MADIGAIDYTSMFSLLQAWDTDNDGLVTSNEFKQGLSSIGFQISSEDADTLCRAALVGDLLLPELVRALVPLVRVARDTMAPSERSRVVYKVHFIPLCVVCLLL